MKKVLLIIALLLFSSVSVFANIVVLQTGQRVEGDIVERDDDYIRMEYEGVDVTFYLDEIASIDGREVEVAEEEESMESSTYSTSDYSDSEPEIVSRYKEESKLEVDNVVDEVSQRETLKQSSSGVSFGMNQGALGSKAEMSLSEKMKKRGFKGSRAKKAAIGAALVPFLIGVIFVVLLIASYWKMHEKAGYPGWSSLVPIYNIYILVKMADKPVWWMLGLFIPIVQFVLMIVLFIEIAKNFGKGVGFGLGLTFLPLIFVPIIGFGSAQYKRNEAPVNPFTQNELPEA